MRLSPAQFEPLDLARKPRVSVRKLSAADLNPAARLAGGSASDTRHDQLVNQTRDWVAQTFFGTLLKQMGDSAFKSDLFSGGRGGEAFSSLYHQQLAGRMARGAGEKLVSSIVRRIEAKQKGSGFGVQGSEKKQDAGLDFRQPRTRTTPAPPPPPAATSPLLPGR